MVATGQADIVKAGGEEIYTAAIDFGLYPFASEDYQLGTPAGVEYNPVMLVGKPFCDAYANNGFLALQNKGLCSTGYRKTAGWAVPLGALMSSIPNEFTATLRDGTDAPDVVNDAGACCLRVVIDPPFSRLHTTAQTVAVVTSTWAHQWSAPSPNVAASAATPPCCEPQSPPPASSAPSAPRASPRPARS